MTRTLFERAMHSVFLRDLRDPARVLFAGARAWAHLSRTGDVAEAARVWLALLHYARCVGALLADWRPMGVIPDPQPDDKPRQRLLLTALALHYVAAAGPVDPDDERVHGVLDALQRAALDLERARG